MSLAPVPNRFSSERESWWNVYYELYVDVLFLVNFMMDYLLLLLVKKMLKCTATHGRICLGAALGALFSCVVMILPIPFMVIKFVLFHVVVNVFMIQAGLKIKKIKELIKAYLLLYVGGFLLGGIMQALHQYVSKGSLFFAIAAFGYYLASKLWDIIAHVQKVNKIRCDVELYWEEKTFLIKGLIDTGNGLKDPVSHKPVSIIDKAVAKEFLGEMKLAKVRYFPFHSIGIREGLLLAGELDKMCIHYEQEIWIEKPLIGVSEEKISSEGEYQMILNPNLL